MHACSAHINIRIDLVSDNEMVELTQLENGRDTNTMTVELTTLVDEWRLHKGKVTKQITGCGLHS